MKRWISVLMAVVLLCVAVPMTASAQEISIEVNGRNCNRDAGKLIVYTDAYGESTGTNFWGAEAVVDSNNKVIEITNGNSTIPEGGFVVSGHDDDEKPEGKKMKTWVRQNITIGKYVYYDHRMSMLTVSDEPLPVKSPFFSFDNPADGVNTVRGDNQQILYTPEHGATTGTGEYGYEVVVENGIVTKLGGNNSAIPENGFVVSLHGHTAGWMRLKIVKGMEVEVEDDTLNVVFKYSAAGLQKAITYLVEQAQGGIDEAKAAFVYADYDAIQSTLDGYKATYQAALDAFNAEGDENAFADCCDELIEKISVLCNSLCDSYPVQYRGVWIRPSQKTAQEVDAYVKSLHDASINFVCVEGWFENGVIMEVPEGSMFGRHPSFKYDVLKAYVDACHKYGMECHLWMPIMCVGSLIDNGYETNSVMGQNEDWLSLNQAGSPYNKDGFMMVDPANEEAKAYFLDFYKYIITTYDIDCFEMDYIRYYAKTGEADFGYTEAAFAGFKEAYGYDVTPQYNPGADYWEDWCQYRRDCVTQWVKDIRAMIDAEAPDMLLAADVAFPFEHALDVVYQEFPQWLEDGLIDILHPMAYGDGFGEDIQKAVELAGDRCMVVTGLGAHMDLLGAKELERQARENTLYGASGECYFEAIAYLADQVAVETQKTVYRTDALPPFLDTEASIEALLTYMCGRVQDVILPLGGMTEAEAKAITDAVASVKATRNTGTWAVLQESVGAVANEKAKQALLGDLKRVERIVNFVGLEPGEAPQTPPGTQSSDDAQGKQTGMSPLWWIVIGVVGLGAAAVIIVAVAYKPNAKKKTEESQDA